MDERNPTGDDAEIEDLEAIDDDAAAVKGGRLADPCEGGE